MLSVPEAAARTGRSPETIRRWIRSGRLPARKIGTQHFVEAPDLDEAAGSLTLPLPDVWRTMRDGRAQLDWVKLVRESRAGH